jgi:hypothetical protein
MQVYFVDIDVNEGKCVQKEFEDEFGQGMATFLELDVTDKERFEGIELKLIIFSAIQTTSTFMQASSACAKSNVTM